MDQRRNRQNRVVRENFQFFSVPNWPLKKILRAYAWIVKSRMAASFIEKSNSNSPPGPELYYPFYRRYYLQTNKFIFITKNHVSFLLWRAMNGFWGTGRSFSTRKRKRFQWFWGHYFSSYFQSSSLLRASILLYSHRLISLSSFPLRLVLLLFFVNDGVILCSVFSSQTVRRLPLGWSFGLHGVSVAIILLEISLGNRISLCCKSVTVIRQGKLKKGGKTFPPFSTWRRGFQNSFDTSPSTYSPTWQLW